MRHAKKLLILCSVVAVFGFVLSASKTVEADDIRLRSPSPNIYKRTVTIVRTLDCVESHTQNGNDIDYDDVCYVDETPAAGQRAKEIENALDWAEERSSQKTAAEEVPVPNTAPEGIQSSVPQQTYFITEDELQTEGIGDYKVQTPKPPEQTDHRTSLNHFEFSTYVSSIEYKEPDVMCDKGMMYGISGSYIHRLSETSKLTSADEIVADLDKNNVFKVDGTFGWGYVDYDSEGSGSMDDVRDFMFETRGLAGYDFHPTKSLRLTPYIGIGFRYLNDDSAGRTTSINHYGYERESHYYYVPFRIEALQDLRFGWALGAAIEYDYLIVGYQESHIEDVDPNYSTVDNEQKTGYGIRGSARLIKYTRHFDFLFEPFVRYWSIEDSETDSLTYAGVLVGYGYEPKNNSLECGVRIGARY